MNRVIVDTGPLVALLNRNDTYHEWVLEALAQIKPPLITCEAVIAEAMFLVRAQSAARLALLDMLAEGFLSLGISLASEHANIAKLVKRYGSVPMSLADACLVRLAELNSAHRVFTLDSDFLVYRKNGRQKISLISPFK